MADIRSILAEVKPRISALVDELVSRGADRLSVVYVLEKEIATLRDGPAPAAVSRAVEVPSNDWPGAGQ